MAVYYIDPYTITNGTGTWASPYSFSLNGRTAWAPGDELRIVAKYLTSLLTATAYVASRPAVNQITITSGGGLGADFAVGDIVYFSDYDSFARVTAVATNTLTFGTAPIPIPTTAAVTINARKLDLTVATPSSNVTAFHLLGTSDATGVTVTDGWVAAGTRVTDGTAKSIIRSSSTSSAANALNLDQQTASSTPKYTINAPHSHFLGGAPTTALQVGILSSNAASVTVNQFYGNAGNAAYLNDNVLSRRSAVTYTVNHWTGSLFYFSTTNGVINITNFYAAVAFQGVWYGFNVTCNIQVLVINTLATGEIFYGSSAALPSATYNFTTVDIYQSAAPTRITTACGPFTVNLLGTVYYNQRASTLTSISYRYELLQAMSTTTQLDFYTPTVNLGGSITAVNNDKISGFQIVPAVANTFYQPYFKPAQYRIYAGNSTEGFEPNLPRSATNILVTHASGAPAYELLGVPSNPVTSTTVTPDTTPRASLDATVFRTAGPSIKIYLATYTSTVWTYGGVSGVFATKNIRVPVVSGTTYTISGYIRTDQTTFANGQCVVALTNGRSISNSQNMTTACINAWEQFSFSYTATITQEIYIAVSVQFSAGAKSFWVDDVTIV